MGPLQGQFEGFEQKYIFPAPLIYPIGKIAKEWHGKIVDIKLINTLIENHEFGNSGVKIPRRVAFRQKLAKAP
jgi:hypothetical protein